MTDIARQTVEFLYEENGGMPRDLHLPTIDDIKEELAKFTIDRVRKGTTVVVRPLAVAPGTSHHPLHSAGGAAVGTMMVLPKFAVRGMLKTFGLPGTVLDVDQVLASRVYQAVLCLHCRNHMDDLSGLTVNIYNMIHNDKNINEDVMYKQLCLRRYSSPLANISPW